jgi:hydrogenase nickel incorporation protein HypB
MPIRTIEVRERVMARNDELAAEVRRRLTKADVPSFNLVSSPGAGKTALLERTLDALGREMRIAVVTGDVQTQNDAERLARRTSRLVQAVVTGGACHLDASQVLDSLSAIDLSDTQLLSSSRTSGTWCAQRAGTSAKRQDRDHVGHEGETNRLAYRRCSGRRVMRC